MRAIAKYWTSFDPLRAMFAGNKAFAELKGKWGMENGRWKREKKKLIFHFQREIKHNSDTDGEVGFLIRLRENVSCLTGGC